MMRYCEIVEAIKEIQEALNDKNLSSKSKRRLKNNLKNLEEARDKKFLESGAVDL